MKKLLLSFCLLASTLLAADPVRSLRVDLNKQNAPFTLEAWQGESATWRVYLYQDGGQWIPSSTNYGGLMGFGTNYADSTSMSLATGQMTIATNWIDFAFTGSKLNTNGIFYAQIMVTNATGGKWVFNEGNWSINKSPITGATTPLSLSSVLNWDLYSILGTPPYPTNFLGLSDTPNAYTGQGGKTIAVKGDESGLEFSSAGAGDITAVVAGSGLDGGAVSGVATVALSTASIASLALADTALQPASTQGLVTASVTNGLASISYVDGATNGIWPVLSGLRSTQETVVAWQGSVSGRLDNAGALTNLASLVLDGNLNGSGKSATNFAAVGGTNWAIGSEGRFAAGLGNSLDNIHPSSRGAQQIGYNTGTQTIGNDSEGAHQVGYNQGSRTIGPNGVGAYQIGRVVNGAAATNMGIGSIQLHQLTPGQVALTYGDASLLCGAGTASNKNCIVAGDGQVSHGDASISAATIWGSGTNLGSTVAAQGVTLGTLQGSNDVSAAWQGSVSNRLVGMVTNGGTYSAVTVTNLTAAGNMNFGGFAPTNFSTLSDPSILTGVSNTITLGGAINRYYWDLTNNSQITFAPCISNKGSSARLDVNKSGFSLTLNAGNCITNGLGNISACTNVAESGNYSYMIDQGVMGTNVYARKIGVYQLR